MTTLAVENRNMCPGHTPNSVIVYGVLFADFNSSTRQPTPMYIWADRSRDPKPLPFLRNSWNILTTDDGYVGILTRHITRFDFEGGVVWRITNDFRARCAVIDGDKLIVLSKDSTRIFNLVDGSLIRIIPNQNNFDAFNPVIDPVSRNLVYSEVKQRTWSNITIMLDLDTGEKRELPFLDYFGVDNGGRFYSKDTNEDIEVRFISEGEWNVIDHFIVEEVDPREASSIKILSNNGIAFRMVDRVVITDPQFSDEGKPAIKKKSDVDKWQML